MLFAILAENCNDSDRNNTVSVEGSGGAPGEDGGAAGQNNEPGGKICQSEDDCSGDLALCDPNKHLCVECLDEGDCEDNAECASGTCVPVIECQNSRDDCPSGTVCVKEEGEETGICYECGIDADCGDGRECHDHACKLACESDNACVDSGLLCDPDAGFCVECLASGDCADTHYCEGGACKPDLCEPGSSTCAGNAVATCKEDGAGFDEPVACDAGNCVESGGEAQCSGGEGGGGGSGGSGGSSGSSGSGGGGGSGGDDACPDDPDKTAPGACGCGFPEVDACLVHRYSFDGDGTTAFDTVGSAHGTLTGSSQVGGFVSFTGGVDRNYVTLPAGILDGLSDATFEAWVDWYGGGGPLQRIFDFGNHDATSGTSYIYLMANTADGRVRAAYSLNGLANEIGAESKVIASANDLGHLAVVVDAEADTLSLYLDGKFEASAALAYPLSSIGDAWNYLGHSQYAADPDFLAALLEFRIYSTARTTTQIKASRDAGPEVAPTE
jgi:hypothetical protein